MREAREGAYTRRERAVHAAPARTYVNLLSLQDVDQAQLLLERGDELALLAR